MDNIQNLDKGLSDIQNPDKKLGDIQNQDKGLRECSSLRSNASVNTVKCFQGIPKEFRGNMTVLLPMHLILNYCIHIVVK